jgi:hypothetical protein
MVAACENETLSNVLPQQYALGHCDEQFSISVSLENDGVTNSLSVNSIMGLGKDYNESVVV